jgi:hypothetical protein
VIVGAVFLNGLLYPYTDVLYHIRFLVIGAELAGIEKLIVGLETHRVHHRVRNNIELFSARYRDLRAGILKQQNTTQSGDF